MKAPGKLTKPLLEPDVLIFSKTTLPAKVVSSIGRLKGVSATERISEAQFFLQEQEVTYAAVNPATFRRWALVGTAQTDAVWDRVADGEMAIAPKLGRQLQDKTDSVKMGGSASAPLVHIGAYAQIFDASNALGLDAVVNKNWVPKLHMVPNNGLLIATGATSPQKIQTQLRKLAGKTASVQILGPNFDIHAVQTAILTGESLGSAVGAFNYTANADGTVNPERAWVAANIRTVQVPIIGTVTCNKAMLPQLIDVLSEIQQRGLAKYLNPSQYGGCFVPRYIAGTHQLSYHAFGLAIDLNVPGNQRGTRGQMNPQIVDIFHKWGFEWGGTWHYTDPMHFQLDRIVRAG
jgi:hypothetical protein